MFEKYPDKIPGKITMTKSTDNLYVEFKPDLPELDRENFYQEKKNLLNLQTKRRAEIQRKLMARKPSIDRLRPLSIVQPTIKTKQIFSLKKPTTDTVISINEEIKNIEQDNRILAVQPTYYREDLPYPNNFILGYELIVKFRTETHQDTLNQLGAQLDIERVRDLGSNLTLFTLLNKKDNVLTIAEELRKNPNVQYVNINWAQTHNPLCGSVNAEYFSKQWNLKKMELEDAWDISTGSPLAVIALIDTGIDVEHPSLKPQLVQSDRWHDFVNKNNLPIDENGHGTVCSGIAAAYSNALSKSTNHKEQACVAGIAYNCRIMPIRIFQMQVDMDQPQLTPTTIIDALNFARCVDCWQTPTANWKSPKHAHVVSMSLSYDGQDINCIDETLDECHKAGMVLVAAAGNYGKGRKDLIAYPASNPNVIAVGASNKNDKRCVWNERYCPASQHGKELCVMAPGSNIYGPDLREKTPDQIINTMRSNGMGNYLPTDLMYGMNNFWDYMGYFDYDHASNNQPQKPRKNIGDPEGNYYFKFHGTSAATPQVAGLAALILAYNPDLSPDQVRQIIIETADKVGNPTRGYVNGHSNYMGYGRINAKKALQQAKNNYPYTPADVYLRKTTTDTGQEPYSGTQLYSSPDIIMLTTSDKQKLNGDPQKIFADKNITAPGEILELGNDNALYIRAHNKGTKKTNIHVRLYSTPCANTFNPETWDYFGQYDFYDVDAGSTVVSEATNLKTLTDANKGDIYSIIASIEGFRDSHPNPVGLTITQTEDLFKASNNLAAKKITIK
jgi:thermitase